LSAGNDRITQAIARLAENRSDQTARPHPPTA
jgi:hypothetical protein